MPLSGKIRPGDFGADLTIVLQASVEYHPQRCHRSARWQRCFTPCQPTLPLAVKLVLMAAVRRAIDVQRSAGVTSVETVHTPPPLRVLSSPVSPEMARDRLAPTVRMVPSSNCLRADRFTPWCSRFDGHPCAKPGCPVVARDRERYISCIGAAVAVVMALNTGPAARQSEPKGTAVDTLIVICRVIMAVVAAGVIIR